MVVDYENCRYLWSQDSFTPKKLVVLVDTMSVELVYTQKFYTKLIYISQLTFQILKILFVQSLCVLVFFYWEEYICVMRECEGLSSIFLWLHVTVEITIKQSFDVCVKMV